MDAAFFEGAMLVCFGLAWPIANVRMLRRRRPEGRGLLCTWIVLVGYLAGDVAKFMSGHGDVPPPVFWLYLFNTASVMLNLGLQWHFGKPQAAAQPAFAPSSTLRPV